MRNRILMVALATAGMTIGYAAPASAQATRTWVSGVGDDVNPCSRTAPCKTFAGAISKTAAGGEINCLDPGGFGAVSINKSLVIDCHYTEGGALAGGNGITVNDALGPTPAQSVVVLRGLDIFGVSPPTHGIRILSAAAVLVEDCVIRRFNAASSFGISFQPSTTTNLIVTNTTISQNGSGATGGGINIQPTGTGVGRVSLRDVRIDQNANTGVFMNSTGNTGIGIALHMDDTRISGTTGDGLRLLQPVGTAGLFGMVTNSTISNNSASGISANGSSIAFRAGNNTITGNAFVSGAGVLLAGGAVIQTYLDNRLDGNATEGAFTAGSIPKK
ncbi:MAG TPA: right-handed parallel beta-helix repeat-containing protein [Allosphingosinicella sp.]|jgi:hypothetical protein|nr:right-handed parallel beta-helix repeat-containing protein [Allosphingosinicella sp.]